MKQKHIDLLLVYLYDKETFIFYCLENSTILFFSKRFSHIKKKLNIVILQV